MAENSFISELGEMLQNKPQEQSRERIQKDNQDAEFAEWFDQAISKLVDEAIEEIKNNVKNSIVENRYKICGGVQKVKGSFDQKAIIRIWNEKIATEKDPRPGNIVKFPEHESYYYYEGRVTSFLPSIEITVRPHKCCYDFYEWIVILFAFGLFWKDDWDYKMIGKLTPYTAKFYEQMNKKLVGEGITNFKWYTKAPNALHRKSRLKNKDFVTCIDQEPVIHNKRNYKKQKYRSVFLELEYTVEIPVSK